MGRSVHSTLKRFMTEIFGADIPQHKPHGLLSVEHSGRPADSNDGSCLSLLVSIKVPLESVCLIDKYSWLELDKTLGGTTALQAGQEPHSASGGDTIVGGDRWT